MKYFEDIRAGEVWTLGEKVVSEAEIIEFASQFDPQPFHTDPYAAKESSFGGLIASGWHICAIFMGLLADAIRSQKLASLGAPGMDHCRWLTPVRPGDTLNGTTTVLNLRPSKSKPMGLVTCQTKLLNQRGEAVAELEGVAMYGCRPKSIT